MERCHPELMAAPASAAWVGQAPVRCYYTGRDTLGYTTLRWLDSMETKILEWDLLDNRLCRYLDL